MKQKNKEYARPDNAEEREDIKSERRESGETAENKSDDRVSGIKRGVPIILIAVAVFITIAFISGSTGILGKTLGALLLGCFSWVAYLIPAFLVLHAIFFISDIENHRVLTRAVFSVMALLTISVLLYAFSSSGEQRVFSVSSFYNEGKELRGGGFFGGVIGYGIIYIFGMTGLIIISIAVVALYLIYCFGASSDIYKKFFSKPRERIKKSFGERKKDYRKAREDKIEKKQNKAIAKKMKKAYKRRGYEISADDYFMVDGGLRNIELLVSGNAPKKKGKPSGNLYTVEREDDRAYIPENEPAAHAEPERKESPVRDRVFSELSADELFSGGFDPFDMNMNANIIMQRNAARGESSVQETLEPLRASSPLMKGREADFERMKNEARKMRDGFAASRSTTAGSSGNSGTFGVKNGTFDVKNGTFENRFGGAERGFSTVERGFGNAERGTGTPVTTAPQTDLYSNNTSSAPGAADTSDKTYGEHTPQVNEERKSSVSSFGFNMSGGKLDFTASSKQQTAPKNGSSAVSSFGFSIKNNRTAEEVRRAEASSDNAGTASQRSDPSTQAYASNPQNPTAPAQPRTQTYGSSAQNFTAQAQPSTQTYGSSAQNFTAQTQPSTQAYASNTQNFTAQAQPSTQTYGSSAQNFTAPSHTPVLDNVKKTEPETVNIRDFDSRDDAKASIINGIKLTPSDAGDTEEDGFLTRRPPEKQPDNETEELKTERTIIPPTINSIFHSSGITETKEEISEQEEEDDFEIVYKDSPAAPENTTPEDITESSDSERMPWEEPESADAEPDTMTEEKKSETVPAGSEPVRRTTPPETAPSHSVTSKDIHPSEGTRVPKINYDNYKFPPISLLSRSDKKESDDSNAEIQANAETLIDTLASFNVSATIGGIDRGPRITRYEVVPAKGVRVSAVTNLFDDISLNLAVAGIRMEAPIPGRAAIGFEVPNKVPSIVSLRDLIDSEEFASKKSKTSICMGMDVTGTAIYGDIAKMPHVLIAGATGMGKSVCINSILISLLYKARPDEVKLIMIDPKKVELNGYNGIPHLLIPVVTEPKQAAGALMWAVEQMEKRFDMIEELNVRNIDAYNEVVAASPEKGEKMPKIIIVIDELNDLMIQVRDPVENLIMRIAQKARAAGIHLIIGTQRPSVNVITGVIKANIPSRIAFKVSSNTDSRTILDMAGAEKLLNNGDMLYAPVGLPKPTRVQGAFVSDHEVESIMNFIRNNTKGDVYDNEALEEINRAASKCTQNSRKGGGDESDEGGDSSSDGLLSDQKFLDAVELAFDSGKISTSQLQRRIGIGYGRAAKYIDAMEDLGIVSEPDGQKPRDVLLTRDEWNEMLSRRSLD